MVFPFTLKRGAGVSKPIHFEEHFRKVPFSVDDLSGLVRTVDLTVKIKLRFQFFFPALSGRA